jgi:class 3 adenylate cyclase
MKPSRELRDATLGGIHDLGRGDLDAWLEGISLSEDTVFIGSDPAEFWVGGPQIRAVLRQQLSEVGRMQIDLRHVHAYEEGAIGWVAASWAATYEDGTVVDFRSSSVARREAEGWKSILVHVSIPVPNPDAIGLEVTTAIEDVAELVGRERPRLDGATSPEGTVTIMFTDLESSTATNEALGDDAFLPLLLKHNEIVRSRTQECRGTVVKSQGDGFMLAFSSARRAVECAIGIQREVAALDRRLKVRMGLHTGEPVRATDDFFGRDVAYAARIGSAAEGGEILISALVRSLVEPSGSVVINGPRELALKGFHGPQAVYSVAW